MAGDSSRPAGSNRATAPAGRDTTPDHDSWVRGYVAAMIGWNMVPAPATGFVHLDVDQMMREARRHAENVWMEYYPETMPRHTSCGACTMARQVGRPGCQVHYPTEYE